MFSVLSDSPSLPVMQHINCLMKTLTNNKLNVEGLYRVQFWENAAVDPAVSHLRVVDLYGGVTVHQLVFIMRDSTSELLILTYAAVIVMNA